MKKNAFILLFLTGVFSAIIYFYPASTINSEKLSEDSSYINTSKRTQELSLLSAKVSEETKVENESVNVEVKLELVETEDLPSAREEAFVAQKQAALEASGLLDRIQQGNDLRAEFKRKQVEYTERMSPNRRTKESLNIDVVKDFNVDFDAASEEIRTSMRAKHNTELVKRLEALGVESSLQQQFLVSREQLDTLAKPPIQR